MKEEFFKRQLEELHLVQCSLLPTEHIVFLDSDDKRSWARAIEQYNEDPLETMLLPESPASFALSVEGSKVWFEITLASFDCSGISKPSVSVKGEDITRADQDRWQIIIIDSFEEISNSE